MFFKLKVSLLATAILLFLSACGGGGGKGTPPPPPEPQNQIITFASSSLTGQVGETLSNIASGGAGVGLITYSSSDPSVASVDSNSASVTLLAVGTITITANKAASTGFNAATASYSLVVTPGNQSITFADPGPIAGTYGDSVTNIASGGTGNGAIIYQSSDQSIATVDSNSGVVSFVGVGAVTVTATKAADANYNQATATYQIDVAKVAQTIVFADAGPLSGTVAGNVSNTASGGAGSGDISYSSPDTTLVSVDANTGAVNLIGAGTATVVATKAADAFYKSAVVSYVINIAKADQSISFSNPGPVNGQVDNIFTNSAGGGNGTGAISYFSDETSVATVDFTTGQVTFVGSGSAVITATKVADQNYNAASAGYTVNAIPGDQTITFSDLGPVAVQVDDIFANAASGGNGSGAIIYESDDTSVATVDINGGQIIVLAVGTATITATKAADTNYNQAVATYTLNVSKGDQVINFNNAGPIGLEIGNTNTNIASGGAGIGTISYSSFDSTIASVDPTTGEVTANGVGSVVITATKATDANYNQAQATYDVNVSLITQVIGFGDPGPIEVLVGTTSINNAASGGGGTGLITYESSDTNIATVNNSGVVTVITSGGITVTATKAASGDYAEAQASYNLNIENTVDISGWLRDFDSFINFPDFSAGSEFIRSTDPACDVNDPLNCTGGQTNTVTVGGTINDFTLGKMSSGYFWLKNGSQVSDPMYASVQTFQERISHNVVFFNNRYWVIGGGRTRTVGVSTQFFPRNDIWSSADGKTWRPETAPAFTSPWYLEAVVFNGKIWLIGTETWSTDDGVNWTEETTSNMSFVQSAQMNSAVFNNEIWIRSNNLIYSSPDGLTWTQRADVSAFATRSAAQFIAYNNSLWLIAGMTPTFPNDISHNDVWKSNDGIDWQQVSSDSGFSPRHQHSAFVLNNKLWVLGGQDTQSGSSRACDTWSTTDGINWTEEVNDSSVDCFFLSEAIVVNNSVKLVSGIQTDWSSDVLESTDGINWKHLSPHSQFSGRTAHRTLTFDSDSDGNDELFVIGGFTVGQAATNDIWQSNDAKTWTQVNTNGSLFEPRITPGAVVFNNQLWIVGGYGNEINVGGNDVLYGDVWTSLDGQNWTEVNSNAPFGPRSYPQLLVFNSKLWLIGGSGSDGTNAVILSDIWSSVDGVTWIEENASAAFGPRTGSAVAAYNGQLWLVGGSDGTVQYNDVWTSSNGVDWTLVTANAAFSQRMFHTLTVHNNLMWVVGGTDKQAGDALRNNELWSSSDGITWTLATNYKRFSRRSTHTSTSFQNDLCIIGGFSNYLPEISDHAGLHNDVWCSSDPNSNPGWLVNYNDTFTFP